MSYSANNDRYAKMVYNRVGASGLKLPAISLGLWQNFGQDADMQTMKEIITGSFDLGITHFDLANAYGPPAGAAETNFGKIFNSELKAYRNEIIISTKAGNPMWNGVYGTGGSRKHLIASIDESLKRTGLEYFDIFYHHKFDPETSIEETAYALDSIVRQGKALYVGTSNYDPVNLDRISNEFVKMRTPHIIHQAPYNMLDRKLENTLSPIFKKYNLGAIAYSPLAQGLLTDKYLRSVPEDSRVAKNQTLAERRNANLERLRELNEIAEKRGQTLAQMALSWVLQSGFVDSVIVGASSFDQVKENIGALGAPKFSPEEQNKIYRTLADTIVR